MKNSIGDLFCSSRKAEENHVPTYQTDADLNIFSPHLPLKPSIFEMPNNSETNTLKNKKFK